MFFTMTTRAMMSIPKPRRNCGVHYEEIKMFLEKKVWWPESNRGNVIHFSPLVLKDEFGED